MKNLKNGLWGIVLIVIGCILALNAIGITNINIFFKGWWTLFIIIPSFIDLFDNKKEKTGSIIGLVIGVLLLLSCQKITDFDITWKLLLPIVLIIIGLSFIFKNFINSNVNSKIKEKGEKSNNKEKRQ